MAPGRAKRGHSGVQRFLGIPDRRATFESTEATLPGRWDRRRLERVLANLLSNAR